MTRIHKHNFAKRHSPKSLPQVAENNGVFDLISTVRKNLGIVDE